MRVGKKIIDKGVFYSLSIQYTDRLDPLKLDRDGRNCSIL